MTSFHCLRAWLLLPTVLAAGCLATTSNSRDAVSLAPQASATPAAAVDTVSLPNQPDSLKFAVLGDFNRRLALPDDAVWADWDDASPANADLARASGDQSARCNPRYKDFIDYIVLDRRAAADLQAFEEATYSGESLSDHCAIAARLTLR